MLQSYHDLPFSMFGNDYNCDDVQNFRIKRFFLQCLCQCLNHFHGIIDYDDDDDDSDCTDQMFCR